MEMHLQRLQDHSLFVTIFHLSNQGKFLSLPCCLKYGIKGIVHPKPHILSFTQAHVFPNLYDFHSSVKHTLKIFPVPIGFHCIFVYTVEVNGNRNCLVINILQNTAERNPYRFGRIFILGGLSYLRPPQSSR